MPGSRSWFPLGVWQLGLNYLGFSGNGDYGLDTLAADSDITGKPFSMNNVITAALNSTDFFLGFFGLGITQGSFGNKIAESPLTQAVKAFGWIPSYSYGYTAGAYYGKRILLPNSSQATSLTDPSRLRNAMLPDAGRLR